MAEPPPTTPATTPSAGDPSAASAAAGSAPGPAPGPTPGPSPEAPAILSVRGLSKVYDNGVQALRDISFDVREGEFLAIIGLSGSGKSTLIRCINRLIEPSSGTIEYRGRDITKIGYGELRRVRTNIGMIFQHFNLVARKSVLANVLSGRLGQTPVARSIFGVFSSEERERALAHLETVGLRGKSRSRADELSGGQQQRVAIARTLMQDPEILLADEPVASLDPATSHSVMQYLRHAREELGQTILCNLHFLSLVREYATRVIALKNGEMVFEGDAHAIDEAWFRRIYGEEAREIGIE